MEFREIVGIDVSKKTLDAHLYKQNQHKQFGNTSEAIHKLIQWASKHSEVPKEQMLFVFEHTGLYSYQLSLSLSDEDYNYAVISGLEIRKSMGITRGKDDRIDSKKIALYGYRLREELEPCRMSPKAIQVLKRYTLYRQRLVQQRAGFKTSLGEIKQVLKKKDNEFLFKSQQRMIRKLDKEIEKLEKEMMAIINENQEFQDISDLIISITGIGPQTAYFMICYTQAFTKFETWRQFASYCGVAPFPNSSGTSLRGKTKTSNLANKKVKAIIDQAAKSAIQYNTELRLYYHRRVEEGKNKMSTINVVRNKLPARIFAVVKRGTPYVDTLKYAN